MIERNQPCPCGSGKKYKKCCGAGAGADKGTAAQDKSATISAGFSALPHLKAPAGTGPQRDSGVASTATAVPENVEELSPFLITTGRGLQSERTDAERKKHLRRRIQDKELRGTLVYNSGAFFKPPAK
jgi:hypothetical protein